MKNLVLILTLVLTSQMAMAEKKVKRTQKKETTEEPKPKHSFTTSKTYGMAGCGLGSVLFGSDDSKGMQILAGTTNGTSLNNTFGVTFGTLNCSTSPSAAAVADTRENMIKFITANKQELETDVAKNGGETVNTLAVIMQVEDKQKFSAKLQKNYASIFSHSEPSAIANAILDVI